MLSARKLMVASLACASTALTGVAATGAQSARGTAVLDDSAARAVASRFITELTGEGDTVVQATVVQTTLGAAFVSVGEDGGGSDASIPIYQISLHGNFTARHAHLPPGASAPTGSDETLMIDNATGQLRGYVIGSVTANIVNQQHILRLSAGDIASARGSAASVHH